MKILFAASPLIGHVNPAIAVARHASTKGDDVVVAASSAFEARVRDADLRFALCEAEGDADFRASEMPPGPERYTLEFKRRFLDAMPGQAAQLRRLIREERPEVIVATSMFLGILPLLSSDSPRPPIAVLNVSFLFHDRPDGAPLGLGWPPASTDEEFARYAAAKQIADQGFTRPVKAYADAMLAKLDARPLPGSLTQSIIDFPDAMIQLTIPSFEYDYGPIPANRHFVGGLPAPAVHGPAPDWWSELDGPRRVVLVTQGTLANTDLTELVEPALAALGDRDDLLVVATLGGRPPEALSAPVPPNARVASYLPFAELLPKISALVTNGGYGTVQQALSAGVPIVSAGAGEDKGEVGARIAWAGFGVNLASDRPTVASIRNAVDFVLEDKDVRSRVQAVSATFKAHDTLEEIRSILHELGSG
jgi:MGT family glycosyltransferase